MNHYQYKKILIIKHGSLGDVISSISAIRPIREFFKGSKIEILTTSSFSTFFSKSKLVDQNIIDNRKGILYSLKIIYIILSKKFDLIIDLQNSKRSSIYCFLIKIFSSVKINGTHSSSHFRYKYNKNNITNVVTGLGNQISLLGIKNDNIPNLSWLEDQNFNIKILNNKNFFIINPGCSNKNKIKRWNPENFAKICTYLLSLNILPVVIGAGNDYRIIKKIEEKESRIINLYNKSPINIIYNLSLKAVGAISNDTGPAHIIASTNCKIHLILSSFSNTETVIPQSKNVTYTQSTIINDIQPDEIFKKIKLLILK